MIANLSFFQNRRLTYHLSLRISWMEPSQNLNVSLCYDLKRAGRADRDGGTPRTAGRAYVTGSFRACSDYKMQLVGAVCSLY